MKKILFLILITALFSCEKMAVIPHQVNKCGMITGKTEFKGKYLIFIDGIGFEFSKQIFDEKNIGDNLCKTQ